MDRVLEWLERAQPDVLLMQETKLGDDDAPLLPFRMRGYELVHHGEGRWNGVAIASRLPIVAASIVTNFGDGPVRNSGRRRGDQISPRRISTHSTRRAWSARVVGGIRLVVPVRAQRARSRFAVLHRQAGLVRAAAALAGGRPGAVRRAGHRRRHEHRADRRTTSGMRSAVHGGTHVSAAERAGLRRAARLGARRRLPIDTP